MGREANALKDRKCHTCSTVFKLTAEELKRHSVLCVDAASIANRLNAIGLVRPTPNLVIRRINND